MVETGKKWKQEEPIISLHNLTLAYGHTIILDHINFSIHKGAMMGIIGPNGAGKSTLLKGIMNLMKATDGHVEFSINGEKDTRKARRYIAYVPQTSSVQWDFPATVLDIVLMGRYGHCSWFRRPRKEDYELARCMIKKVGMSDYENCQLCELSGGQQQRVFLARALVQEAEVYLLDEPFKGIDVQSEKTIIGILQELQRDGKTMVVVHHALHTVPEYFDSIALINRDLIAWGPTGEVFTEDKLEETYHYSVQGSSFMR